MNFLCCSFFFYVQVLFKKKILPETERMDVDNAGFTDLLQQAEQLTADIDGEGELPRVERNLRQIVDAGQQLWSRTTQAVSKDTCDIKA